jgi:hypothetical protein
MRQWKLGVTGRNVFVYCQAPRIFWYAPNFWVCPEFLGIPSIANLNKALKL